MRIGLIAPPFIEIPPRRYGGTELFIANLACELHARGHDVTVYGNGDSHCRAGQMALRAVRTGRSTTDARATEERRSHRVGDPRRGRIADVLHLNDIVGVPFTPFIDVPAVLTIHHPHEPVLSEQYLQYPQIHYVAIADWLARAPRADAAGARRASRHSAVSDYTFVGRERRLRRVSRPDGAVQGPAPGHRGGAARRRPAEARRRNPADVSRLLGAAGRARYIDGDQIEYVGEADLR